MKRQANETSGEMKRQDNESAADWHARAINDLAAAPIVLDIRSQANLPRWGDH